MEFDNVLFQDDSKPLCGRGGCFANRDGCCEILTDNDFGERECPFYKQRGSEGLQ